MEDKLYLKRGLITQSLSPVFALLIIRHMHLDYPLLISRFLNRLSSNSIEAIEKAIKHPRFGELIIVIIGMIWVASSIISIPAFRATEEAGFISKGEKVVATDEKKDAAASFLMTFILPLLIDDLSSPQNWISYILVLLVVYAVLYQSNLYYQSPVLAFLGYKVFTFKVLNPYKPTGLKEDKEYIGITRKTMITEEAAILWKHISDGVFLVYNEGVGNTKDE